MGHVHYHPRDLWKSWFCAAEFYYLMMETESLSGENIDVGCCRVVCCRVSWCVCWLNHVFWSSNVCSLDFGLWYCNIGLSFRLDPGILCFTTWPKCIMYSCDIYSTFFAYIMLVADAYLHHCSINWCVYSRIKDNIILVSANYIVSLVEQRLLWWWNTLDMWLAVQ